jgi:hypothetical protein
MPMAKLPIDLANKYREEGVLATLGCLAECSKSNLVAPETEEFIRLFIEITERQLATINTPIAK